MRSVSCCASSQSTLGVRPRRITNPSRVIARNLDIVSGRSESDTYYCYCTGDEEIQLASNATDIGLMTIVTMVSTTAVSSGSLSAREWTAGQHPVTVVAHLRGCWNRKVRWIRRRCSSGCWSCRVWVDRPLLTSKVSRFTVRSYDAIGDVSQRRTVRQVRASDEFFSWPNPTCWRCTCRPMFYGVCCEQTRGPWMTAIVVFG